MSASKKENELRSALKALKVNSPLRLSKSGPGMRPPKEAARDGVAVEEAPQCKAPSSELLQVEHACSEHTQSDAGQSSVPALGAGKTDTSAIEQPRQALPQPEVPNTADPNTQAAGLEVPPNQAPVRDVPPRERPRGGSISELPQSEAFGDEEAHFDAAGLAEGKLNQGFFKLSHAVFSEPLLRDLSGDSFRLFLWLSSRAWRFSRSNGLIRASVRYIEEHTGMGHATVSRALKTLKKLRLIRLVETDFKRGNVWQISGIALGNKGPDLPPQNEGPSRREPRNGSGAVSNRDSSFLSSRKKLPHFEGKVRSSKNQKDQVQDPTSLAVGGKVSADELEEELREEALARFETTLENSQKETLIQEYSTKMFPHGFLPPSRIVRSMVAWDWFNASTQHQQQLSLAV